MNRINAATQQFQLYTPAIDHDVCEQIKANAQQSPKLNGNDLNEKLDQTPYVKHHDTDTNETLAPEALYFSDYK